LHSYHLQVNKALREYADAFGRAYDPEQALFQYWEGLTNKNLVGFLRQYYSTTFPKPTLEDVMRRASEYTACYNPAVHSKEHPSSDAKPKRRRDGDDDGAAGTDKSHTPGRSGGISKRGSSFKGKPPAKKSGGSQANGKGRNLSRGPGSMTAAQVKEAADKQGVTEDQYLEFNRIKAARGSAECRKLRQKNLCFNCAKSGHSYWDCKAPKYGIKKGSPSKGKGTAQKKQK
jgi:hypothetical protein